MSDNMMKKAKQLVVQHYSEECTRTTEITICEDDVKVTWFSKTLKNWKALLCVTKESVMYYELTYNGEKAETYVDAYRKHSSRAVRDKDIGDLDYKNSFLIEYKNLIDRIERINDELMDDDNMNPGLLEQLDAMVGRKHDMTREARVKEIDIKHLKGDK